MAKRVSNKWLSGCFDRAGKIRHQYDDPAMPLLANLFYALRDCRAEEKQWRNMVAVLCGDGGHYLHEHGVEKTKQHIIEEFHKQRAENERLERDNNHLTDTLIAAGFIGHGTEVVGVKYHEKLKAELARLKAIVEKLRDTINRGQHANYFELLADLTTQIVEAAEAEEGEGHGEDKG